MRTIPLLGRAGILATARSTWFDTNPGKEPRFSKSQSECRLPHRVSAIQAAMAAVFSSVRHGRPVRQIELCDRHAEIVTARERERGLEIFDRRDWS